MKKNSHYLKKAYFICVALFLTAIANRTVAQTVVKETITVSNNSELSVKSIPTIGWNGYKAPANIYPLLVSGYEVTRIATAPNPRKVMINDTLFFNNATDRTFVEKGISSGGITEITAVTIAQPTYKYGGRYYNYYYYCNGTDNGYFVVNGLTAKTNTTFNVTYSSTDKLYTVNRKYNNINYSEVVSTEQVVANQLSADLTAANCTEFFVTPLANLGNFFFFLNRPAPPVTLKTPVITAGGATTFSAGGSVTLSSTSTTGNTWHLNGATIMGATGATYSAIATGTYTVTTTQAGFNTNPSNAIAVTVNNPVAVSNPNFTVSGNKILNNANQAVILKGVNVPVYGSGFSNDLTQVASAIKTNSKSNCARLLWESSAAITALQAYDGYNPAYYTYANLDAALSTYISNHILPILALHDLTDLAGVGLVDENSTAAFTQYVTTFWTDPNIIAILKKYQKTLVINLQNEWGATWDNTWSATAFVSAYQGLVSKLRAAGITCPIMIDAPDGGSNSGILLQYGSSLIANDPNKNVILSVHTYWSQQQYGGITNCPSDYTSYIQALASSNLPFFLGEVSDWCVVASTGAEVNPTTPVSFACPGATSPNQYAIDYDAILSAANSAGIGFAAWSWYQDGNGSTVRNIYNQGTGTSINTSPYAGSFPTDILSSSKAYGLNNASVVPAF